MSILVTFPSSLFSFAESKIFIAQRRLLRKMQYNFLKKPFSMGQKDDII